MYTLYRRFLLGKDDSVNVWPGRDPCLIPGYEQISSEENGSFQTSVYKNSKTGEKILELWRKVGKVG